MSRETGIFTKSPRAIAPEGIYATGLNYTLSINTTARIYSDPLEGLRYATGDDRFSGAGAHAIVMDIPKNRLDRVKGASNWLLSAAYMVSEHCLSIVSEG